MSEAGKMNDLAEKRKTGGNRGAIPPRKRKKAYSAKGTKRTKGEAERNAAAVARRGRTRAVANSPLLFRSRSRSGSHPPLQARNHDEMARVQETLEKEEVGDDDDDDEDDDDDDSDYSNKKRTNTTVAADRPAKKKRTKTRNQALAEERAKELEAIRVKEEEKIAHLDSLEEKHSNRNPKKESDADDNVVVKRNVGSEGLRQRRQAINYYFDSVYKCPPESSGLWEGRNGIVARIRRHLLLPGIQCYNDQMTRTLRLILLFRSKKEHYVGQRKPRKEWTGYCTQKGDFEARLLADLIEQDMGFRETTSIVNEWRLSEGKFPVSVSCVYDTCYRLKPVVTTIKKRQQGSLNLESPWCQASHRWSCQVLLVLGELKQDQAPPKFFVKGEIPKCFLLKDLRQYKLLCVQFWDETHKKQRVGKIRSGTRKQFQFPRDEDGGVDPDNGKPKKRETELNMKYEKEARFMTGMCLLLDSSGNVKKDSQGRPLGMRPPLFECTEKKVVSHQDWMDAWAAAIKAPRSAGDKSKWVQNTRIKGKKYKGDPVTTLPGINDKAADFLEGCTVDGFPQGVITVGDYYNYFYGKQKRRTNFVKAMKSLKVRMSPEIQAKAEAEAEKALPGVPQIIDHRNNPNCRNPWKSRYPEDWNDRILRSPELKNLVSVRELVEHMVEVGEATYKGTRCEHEWCFCHDALSLMCSRECQEWMGRKGYLKYWMLPQHELNTMFPYYKRPMPVGNHAGAMPWDSTCNGDHDDIVLRHVAATVRLREDDERKFSLRSPKKVASAYKRMYNNPPVLRDGEPIIPLGEGGPPAYRLGEDIMKVPKCWRDVFDSSGLNCNTNVPGHRGDEPRTAAKEGRIKKKRGGDHGTKKGKITNIKKSWYHPDARGALNDFLKKSLEEYEGVLEQTLEKYKDITDEEELDSEMVEVVGASKDASYEDIESDVDSESDEEGEEE